MFKELDLDAPITTDDIPAIIEQLEKKTKFYEDQLAEWEATREQKKEAILRGDDSDNEGPAKKEEAEEVAPPAEETANAE